MPCSKRSLRAVSWVGPSEELRWAGAVAPARDAHISESRYGAPGLGARRPSVGAPGFVICGSLVEVPGFVAGDELSQAWASSAALPRPAMQATFSVPARRWRSGVPPCL